METSATNDWDVIRTSLIVYIPSFIGILLLFCYVRLKFPAVYNVRNTVEAIRNPLATTPHNYINWVWKVMRVKDSDLFQTCGMDALCLLRITRMGSYLSLVSVLCSIFLLPVYERQSSTIETVTTTDEFTSTTATALPERSSSFTATVVAAYIIFCSTMLLILNEFRWFIEQRETFLSMQEARNYTVYVTGIPPKHRSDVALANFFGRVIGDDAVHSAVVLVLAPKLRAAVNRQIQLTRTLERLKELRGQNKGKESMHTVVSPNNGKIINRVPAIPHITRLLEDSCEEIQQLKLQIAARQKKKLLQPPDNSPSEAKFPHMSSIQGQLPVLASSITSGDFPSDTEACGTSTKRPSFRISLDSSNGIGANDFDGEGSLNVSTSDVTVRKEISSAIEHNCRDTDATLLKTMSETHPSILSSKELNNERTLQEFLLEHSLNTSNSDEIIKPVTVCFGDKCCNVGTTTDTEMEQEGRLLDAGFVTFTKLSAVAIALQTVQSTVPFQMDVFEAPSPEQVIWSNVGLPNQVLQPRRLLAAVLSALTCLFWTIPVTLLVSLTEIQVLKRKFPFLEDWLIAAPWLEQLLNQLSPLLLSFLNSVVVPILMRQLSTLEGVLGLSYQEASLFSKLATFYVCPLVSFLEQFCTTCSHFDG
jgi:Late exocytosis, associated with Golgi transport/Calcium-dependent channel, 7TM region, putative phosphate/Cytosolic domain of 10TM putative phosphate transporter